MKRTSFSRLWFKNNSSFNQIKEWQFSSRLFLEIFATYRRNMTENLCLITVYKIIQNYTKVLLLKCYNMQLRASQENNLARVTRMTHVQSLKAFIWVLFRTSYVFIHSFFTSQERLLGDCYFQYQKFHSNQIFLLFFFSFFLKI